MPRRREQNSFGRSENIMNCPSSPASSRHLSGRHRWIRAELQLFVNVQMGRIDSPISPYKSHDANEIIQPQNPVDRR
jgi:hypothetical protein